MSHDLRVSSLTVLACCNNESRQLGLTQAVFYSMGRVPVYKERLKILIITGVIPNAVSFSILPDISSGPFALLISIVANNLNTSSSEHSKSSSTKSGGMVS